MSHIFERFNLKGETAIITGGAGLLGKEFGRTLAQAGANVVVADVNVSAGASSSPRIAARRLERLAGWP